MGNRAVCGDTSSYIDIILTEISNLRPFAGSDSGEKFILALEEIFSPENIGNRTDFDRSYILDIWEKAGGEKNLFNPCVKPPARGLRNKKVHLRSNLKMTSEELKNQIILT